MAVVQGNPSTTELAEIVRVVDTNPERGLTEVQAAARLEADGPNELRSAPPVPTWRKVLSQFQDPLIYLLLAAVVIATIAWVVEGANGLPTDSIVITLIVIANAILGYSQEARAEEAVAALQRMTASHATVIRDGRTQLVPASDLVCGDLLVLSEGDSIGADGRVVQANALRVAEASLTGESTAVTKRPGVLAGGEPLGDRTNMVFKGTAVTQGTGRAVVTGTAMDTEMGAVAEMLERTDREPTPLEREIALIGKMLGLVVIVIAVVVMATVWLISGVDSLDDAVTVLLLGVSLAVAAVPEGLPAILSVVLSIGVQRMAQRNAIVKKLSSVETLGSASVICSDKTGTLTNNEMTLQTVLTSSGTSEVTGVGYRPEGEVVANGVVLAATGEAVAGEAGDGVLEAQRAEDVIVLSGGSLASNSELREVNGEWQVLGDPTEAAFLVAERKMGLTERRTARFSRVGEVPFTSERKRMSTLHLDHEHDDRPVLISKGAPDVLLQRCTAVRDGLETRPLDEGTRAAILADVEKLSERAMRTMGVAYRALRAEEVDAEVIASGQVPAETAEQLEHDLTYVGTVGMIDPPRDSAGDAVREAHRAGIRVIMITGDHPSTALRIAQDLGIAEEDAEAVTGLDLDALDGAGFAEVVSRANVFARVAPEHKLRIVDALQEAGEIVAMTGDGVNDAPALKSADIGVAMGITGTEVTKEAGSMILGDDNFATIVAAVRQGRVIFDNIKKFLRYLLSSNMGEVLTVFLGVVLAGVIGLTEASQESIVLPLLATQILWINLVTDSAPALALGVDPETDDVMARRPRAPGKRVIDGRMWGGIVAVGAVMAVATLLTIDIFLPGGLIEGSDSLEVARTAGFTTLVLAQLYNVFNSRSQTSSAFHRFFSNRWLLAAVAFGVVSQVLVVHVPFLQAAFGTADLDLQHWLVCIAMASAVLWFDELLKLVERGMDRRRGSAS